MKMRQRKLIGGFETDKHFKTTVALPVILRYSEGSSPELKGPAIPARLFRQVKDRLFGIPRDGLPLNRDVRSTTTKLAAKISMSLGLIAMVWILRFSVSEERAIAADDAGEVRFAYVDVIVDSKGKGLAAWQIEVAAEVGEISLVGVEAGEHAAYAKKPAYYDPAALKGRRIMVGDYSLEKELPKGKTRVCRLMLEIKGAVKPVYVAKVMAAADGEGKKIDAVVEVVAGR